MEPDVAVNYRRDEEAAQANSPFGSVCQPDDVCNVVRYLVSDKNSYRADERLDCARGGHRPAR